MKIVKKQDNFSQYQEVQIDETSNLFDVAEMINNSMFKQTQKMALHRDGNQYYVRPDDILGYEESVLLDISSIDMYVDGVNPLLYGIILPGTYFTRTSNVNMAELKHRMHLAVVDEIRTLEDDYNSDPDSFKLTTDYLKCVMSNSFVVDSKTQFLDAYVLHNIDGVRYADIYDKFINENHMVENVREKGFEKHLHRIFNYISQELCDGTFTIDETLAAYVRNIHFINYVNGLMNHYVRFNPYFRDKVKMIIADTSTNHFLPESMAVGHGFINNFALHVPVCMTPNADIAPVLRAMIGEDCAVMEAYIRPHYNIQAFNRYWLSDDDRLKEYCDKVYLLYPDADSTEAVHGLIACLVGNIEDDEFSFRLVPVTYQQFIHESVVDKIFFTDRYFKMIIIDSTKDLNRLLQLLCKIITSKDDRELSKCDKDYLTNNFRNDISVATKYQKDLNLAKLKYGFETATHGVAVVDLLNGYITSETYEQGM